MIDLTIPLFPLNTVLFPNGYLPLRIFETRYIDMVSYCLRTDCGFGVCLIRSGNEIGGGATVHTIGTLAKIVDFEQRKDGLLGINAIGQQRFQVNTQRTLANNLLEGDVTLIANESTSPIATKHQRLVNFLRQVIAQIGAPYDQLPTDYDNASWVSQRLAELLPIPTPQRQTLLEMDDCEARLNVVMAVLEENNVQF